jgi:hypothetical protein
MRLVLLVLFAFIAWSSSAQDTVSRETTFPVWTISKPVQQLQFKNTLFTPARVYTGNAWIMAKDVHQLQLVKQRKTFYKVKHGNLPSTSISKGVARMQYERLNKARRKK